LRDLEKIILVTLTGMITDEFEAEGKQWLVSAKDPRWKRPYTELTYQPMLEILSYLRANGFKTYIVTGFGQDFVRLYSQDLEERLQDHLQVRHRYRIDRPACDADLLDEIALRRRHVVLQHVEIFARLALPLLLIKADVVIGPTARDLDRLFLICDKRAEE
jgi:hypothetical protein